MRGIVFLEFPAVTHFTVLYITNALLFSPKTTNFIQFTKLPNGLTKTTYKTLNSLHCLLEIDWFACGVLFAHPILSSTLTPYGHQFKGKVTQIYIILFINYKKLQSIPN